MQQNKGNPFLKKAAGPKPPNRAAQKRGGLGGHGLDALINNPAAGAKVTPDKPAVPTAPAAHVENASGIIEVPPLDLERSPWQARTEFDETALAELTESIRKNGVVQPPLVRRRADGKLELIAGERRTRAAILAGLKKIPVLLTDASDRKAAEWGVVENVQRKDLNAIEEAEGYRLLKDQFGVTQEQVAEQVGKSRSAVANALRLLELPDEVKQLITRNVLTTGHAKVLLSVEGDRERTLLARECVTEKRGANGMLETSVITVRELEKKVARLKRPVTEVQHGKSDLPESYVRALTDALHRQFGCAVRVTSGVTHANGKHTKGMLEIDFYDNDDLDRLLGLLNVKLD